MKLVEAIHFQGTLGGDSAESRRVPSFETRHTIKARRKCFKIKSFDIHLKLKI